MLLTFMDRIGLHFKALERTYNVLYTIYNYIYIYVYVLVSGATSKTGFQTLAESLN